MSTSQRSKIKVTPGGGIAVDHRWIEFHLVEVVFSNKTAAFVFSVNRLIERIDDTDTARKCGTCIGSDQVIDVIERLVLIQEDLLLHVMLTVHHDNVVNMCVRTVRTVNTLMSRMHEARTKTDQIFIAKISPLLPSPTYHSISETLKSVLSSE